MSVLADVFRIACGELRAFALRGARGQWDDGDRAAMCYVLAAELATASVLLLVS